MPPEPPSQRCRLVLIAPPDAEAQTFAPRLEDALGGGDVASVILPQYDLSDDAFLEHAARLVPVVQGANAAAMLAGEARAAYHASADGLHVEAGKAGLADALERHGRKLMVGAGGAKTRHDALELGETLPEYILFGRFGYDTHEEPHRRNIALGRWWVEMTDIPCIVLGGNVFDSVAAVAATGAEFVALSSAVFAGPGDAARKVADANTRLDAHAPVFEG